MSLSKQLLILLSFVFFIVFSASFILSVGNIKNYLEVQSEFHVQDTATSLGLSLSPYMVDDQDPMLRTMMNAIFDMGYYKEMRLEDIDGKELIKLSNTEQIEGVPSWLINLMPMDVATAVSEISSGWNMSGTLYVTANPGYGYLKLYEQAKATLTFSLLIFLAAIILLIIILRLTLKPLKNIEQQANEISAGNFITTQDLPWTLEVKNVAISMNSMSKKIGDMIGRLNGKLESLSENLKQDPLTKLLNQATFEVNLKQASSSGDKGYAAIIKFDDLAFLTKDKGNQAVDDLLIEFAAILNKPQQVLAYRLYGSEFGLLMPSFGNKKMLETIEQLQAGIEQLGGNYQLDDLVHIGIIHFDRTSEYNKLYPAMIEAYEQAKNIGHNAYFVNDNLSSSMSDLEWKKVIKEAIENNTPEITFTAQAFNYQHDPAQKVMEEAFTVIRDSGGNLLPIGIFFSMAQEFNMVEALDKCIVNKVIKLMEETNTETAITINLSMVSVSSHEFTNWLKARLSSTHINPTLLAFSVTAYSAMKDITSFANFASFVKSIGATTLLKRYSSDIIDVEILKDLHIDYLRLARDLTMAISNNSDKAQFLDLIQEVGNLLEIKVLAESVVDDEDFEVVKATNLYGIGR